VCGAPEAARDVERGMCAPETLRAGEVQTADENLEIRQLRGLMIAGDRGGSRREDLELQTASPALRQAASPCSSKRCCCTQRDHVPSHTQQVKGHVHVTQGQTDDDL
jgi:hypothetical protein